MKKLFTVLALSVVTLALFMFDDKLSLQRASASQDDASRFIEHSSHCGQLLGKGLGGDTPHPDMHVALEAALDAIRLPADQAIGQINNRCRERVSSSASS